MIFITPGRNGLSHHRGFHRWTSCRPGWGCPLVEPT